MIAKIARRARDLMSAAAAELIVASDGAGWALDEVAYGIARHVSGRRTAVVVRVPSWVSGRYVHFVNRYLALEGDLLQRLHARNRTILNWSHGGAEADVPVELRTVEARMRDVVRFAHKVQIWTSLYRPVVERIGVPSDRVVVLPLGLELDDFPPARTTDEAKRVLGIPENAICIGSFQRDGEAEPKLVKGPDVLVEVAARLHERMPRLTVVLTGPARGYVRRELAARGVPFRYFGMVPATGRVRYYHACDLYLITSREEGGPISLLEAMAAGVPVVTTKVGMAPDVVRHGENGAMVDVGDVDGLAQHTLGVLSDRARADRIREAALASVRPYGWRALAPRYERELYS